MKFYLNGATLKFKPFGTASHSGRLSFLKTLGHVLLLVLSVGILAAVKALRVTRVSENESGELSFLALACVLAVIMAASCQARSYRWQRYSLVILTLHVAVYLLAAAQIVDLVHDSDIWNYDSSEFIVGGAAVVVAAGLVAKSIIGAQLVAHASDATWTRHKGAGGGPGVSKNPALLRSQARTGRRLIRATLADPNIGSGHVVQLVGHWGSGKSTILRDFASRLANNDLGLDEEGDPGLHGVADLDDPPAVAMLHVWRHEDDLDLHRAMVEAIIGAHLIIQSERLISWRWLRIPSALLIARHLRSITLSITVSLRGSKMRAESIKVPDLFAQRSLDYFLTSGRKTVVILDEIDRATPEVAQAVLTLVRRSLDVAGCTTVLAYAEQIVRFKTMNPMSSLLPDIRSSVEALLSIHVGMPEPRHFDDSTLFRTSDDGSGNWFDQSDWLRRQWLISQRVGAENERYISVDDFYRVIEQKYLSSNLVSVEPIRLFAAAAEAGGSCVAACYDLRGSGRPMQGPLAPAPEDAELAAEEDEPCELCRLLHSPDMQWRLARLLGGPMADRLGDLVEGIRGEQRALLGRLGGAASALAVPTGTDRPDPGDVFRLYHLPGWISPFERFTQQLAERGAPDDGESGASTIADLLDQYLPIRRLVSAWVADLDRLQQLPSTGRSNEPGILARRLATCFSESALRIACDNIHRDSPPSFGIIDLRADPPVDETVEVVT